MPNQSSQPTSAGMAILRTCLRNPNPPPHARQKYEQKLENVAKLLRAARVQNEFAPETFLNRSEKRFEKREKGSEKRSETRLKNF